MARGTGWTIAGPRWAQTIAFAASAPRVAYTCGVPAPGATGGPTTLAVGMSRDSGHTWRTYTTPAAGAACDMTVDPSDPRDVMLVANADPFTNTKPLTLYRSLNGGSTWTSWPLPPRANGGRTVFFAYQWAWVTTPQIGQRSILYLAPYFPDGSIYVWLAASVAGQPFTWVAQHALFPGQPPDGGVAALIAAAGALYMVLRTRTDCPPTCTDVERTTNGGMTWSKLVLSFEGSAVALIVSADDVLFGRVAANTPGTSAEYVYSTDSGTDWNVLTTLPTFLTAQEILRAPDGTLFALLDAVVDNDLNDEGQPGIYVLAPDSPHWRFVAPLSGGALADWHIDGPFMASDPPIALNWDESRHVAALWGAAYGQAVDGIHPGIEYYVI